MMVTFNVVTFVLIEISKKNYMNIIATVNLDDVEDRRKVEKWKYLLKIGYVLI